jgi:hypothetical protein
MRDLTNRAVFTVMRHPSGWAVEHDGAYSDITGDKEIARAAANRRARASQESGQPSQVRVAGEHGYFNPA